MLREIAIADAYGQAFEFIKNPQEKGLKNELENDCLVFQQNPKYVDSLVPGNFTDDTIRTLASAKLIQNYGPDSLMNPATHFEAIHRAFWLFHRKGWSGRFQKFMEDHKDCPPSEIFRKIVRKNTNGALMGILPFGLLNEMADVKNAAAMNAYSTHSAETIPYAQALALTIWFVKNNSVRHLKSFLLDNVENLKIFKGDPWSMEAGDTFNVVLSQIEKAVECSFDMNQLIIDCVNLGGDTDSIAALCAGIFSCLPAYKEDKEFLKKHYHKIENQYNRGVLIATDPTLHLYL